MNDFIKKYEDQKFEWGVFDCSTLTKDYLDYLYPDNTFIDIRGAYNNEKTALEYNKKYKWIDELNKAFEIEEVKNIKEADIILGKMPNGMDAAHIVIGSFVYSAIWEKNLIKLPAWIYHVLDVKRYKIKEVK